MNDKKLIALYQDAWQERFNQARPFFAEQLKFPAESADNLAYHAATMWLKDALNPNSRIENGDNISPMATRKFIEADKPAWVDDHTTAYMFFTKEMNFSPRVAEEMARRTANHQLQRKMLESKSSTVGDHTSRVIENALTIAKMNNRRAF